MKTHSYKNKKAKEPINSFEHFKIKLLTVFLFTYFYSLGQNKLFVINHTGQRINQLDYWIGSVTESQGANLVFKSRGSLENNDTASIPEKFIRKKKNTIIIRAILSGGGYVKTPYSIAAGEKTVRIKLFNPAEPIPADNFEKVVNKFKELKVDESFSKLPTDVAIQSILGSLYVYDSSGKKILYKVRPNELKSVLTSIIDPENTDDVTGIFSSETSVSGSLNLPFVNANSAFEFGDVVKFHWSVENVGEFIWSSANGKDLATLFTELTPETKKALIDVYAQNPGAKMKFIDEVFLIGRIEVETERSKKVEISAEVNGSSFVTAKGNYSFLDALKQHNILKNTVTQIDGYYVSSLLTGLYLNSLLESKNKLSAEENQRVTDEYNHLLLLYPEILKPTDKVAIMKIELEELNAKLKGQVCYLLKKENETGKTKIDPEDVNKKETHKHK